MVIVVRQIFGNAEYAKGTARAVAPYWQVVLGQIENKENHDRKRGILLWLAGRRTQTSCGKMAPGDRKADLHFTDRTRHV